MCGVTASHPVPRFTWKMGATNGLASEFHAEDMAWITCMEVFQEEPLLIVSSSRVPQEVEMFLVNLDLTDHELLLMASKVSRIDHPVGFPALTLCAEFQEEPLVEGVTTDLRFQAEVTVSVVETLTFQEELLLWDTGTRTFQAALFVEVARERVDHAEEVASETC